MKRDRVKNRGVILAILSVLSGITIMFKGSSRAKTEAADFQKLLTSVTTFHVIVHDHLSVTGKIAQTSNIAILKDVILREVQLGKLETWNPEEKYMSLHAVSVYDSDSKSVSPLFRIIADDDLFISDHRRITAKTNLHELVVSLLDK